MTAAAAHYRIRIDAFDADDAFDPAEERAVLEAVTPRFLKLLVMQTIASAPGAPHTPDRHRLEIATRRFMHLLCDEAAGEVSHPVDRIAYAVARVFDVEPPTRMFSAERTDAVARPRHIAMHLARVMLGKSLPAIGLRFHRDHSTVNHALQMVEARLAVDPALRSVVAALKQEIAGERVQP